MKKNNSVCVKCGKSFRMWFNGVVVDDKFDYCDECAGVERDVDGFAWYTGELVQIRAPVATMDDESTFFEVKREDAFRKKGGKIAGVVYPTD